MDQKYYPIYAKNIIKNITFADNVKRMPPKMKK